MALSRDLVCKTARATGTQRETFRRTAGTSRNEFCHRTLSITGCFNKSAEADRYVIKDGKTGKEMVVMGDAAMLSRHANNHEVTLTGTVSKDKDKDVLKATELKMIAVCK